MEQQQKELSVTFKIDSCKLLSFSAQYNEEIENNNFNHDFVYEISSSQNINKDSKNVNIIFEIKIFFDTEKKLLLGEISTSNVFTLINFDELVIKKDDKLLSSFEVAAMLVGLAYSNTRGMLIVKASGTTLQKALLPAMNTVKYLKGEGIN